MILSLQLGWFGYIIPIYITTVGNIVCSDIITPKRLQLLSKQKTTKEYELQPEHDARDQWTLLFPIFLCSFFQFSFTGFPKSMSTFCFLTTSVSYRIVRVSAVTARFSKDATASIFLKKPTRLCFSS